MGRQETTTMSFYGETRKTKGELIRAVNCDHGIALGMKDADLLQNNTLRYSLPDGRKVIRLHDTDIVQIDRKGVVTLDSGGYQTVTTKDRINAYTPRDFSVYSRKGWYVRTPKGTFPYVDGARFKPDGTPCNLKAMQANDKRVAKETAMVDAFMKHVRAVGWGKSDGGGDPWCFSPDVGREVMLDWIKGKYYTRRMASLALETRFMPAGVWLYFEGLKKTNGKPDRFVSGVIRKYVKAQLGLA